MPTTISGPNGEIKFGTGLPTLIIGERINPTGRKKFGQQIASGDLSVIKDEAISQKNAGADVLDVNVGAAGVNEVALLPLAVKEALTAGDLPICVDSANVEALKAALAVYPYKALINSVNGEERSLSSVLPIVKHYGAAVIALTIDESGIPETVEGRIRIVERIVERAESYGISKDDIVVDCLTMAASSKPNSALVTLETLRILSKEFGLASAMGVSNVSFGMPQRDIITKGFLGMCIEAGLTAAIVNPETEGLVSTIYSADFLTGRDDYARKFLTHYRTKIAASRNV